MIEIRNIVKRYDHSSINILNEITCSFPDRGFFVIVGETGCGKSTFLKSLAGMINVEGSILLDGKKPADVRAADIGFVFQDFKLVKNETVIQSVMDGPIAAGFNENDSHLMAENALSTCGVNSLEEKMCSALSFGQMQRVGIARAIAKKPRYLFADEPTGNLDEENARNIMRLLYEISSDALVIVVTHQLKIAQSYADAVFSLSNGKLVEMNLKKDKESIDGKENDFLEKENVNFKKEKKTNQWKWIFRKRMTEMQRHWIVALMLFLLSIGTGISLQMVDDSIRSYEGIEADNYTEDTYTISSNTMLQIDKKELLELFSDSECSLLDPCNLVVSQKTGIKVNENNFSFASFPSYERKSKNEFSIYVLSYDKVEKCDFSSKVPAPKGGVVIDQCIMEKFNKSIIDKENILGGKFTLYKQKLNGGFEPESWEITGISQTGFPFVFMDGVDSLSFNYHYREGFSHPLTEASELKLIDANKLPYGYSIAVEKTNTEEKPIIFLNEKAREILSDWDLSYLGFDVLSNGVLNCPDENKPIVAIYDYPEQKLLLEDGKEQVVNPIFGKQNFLYLLIKASRNMNCVLDMSDKSIIEGRKPIRENEYVISRVMADLVGGLAAAKKSVVSLGVDIVGITEGLWTDVYGCGERECLSALLKAGNYVTRFPTERGKIIGAPRLISYDVKKTMKSIEKKFKGNYKLENTSSMIQAYDGKEAIKSSTTEIVAFGILCFVELVFVFSISFSYSLSLRDSYYIDVCLGYKKKTIISGTVFSVFCNWGIAPLVSAIFLALYFSLFNIVVSWFVFLLVFGYSVLFTVEQILSGIILVPKLY